MKLPTGGTVREKGKPFRFGEIPKPTVSDRIRETLIHSAASLTMPFPSFAAENAFVIVPARLIIVSQG